MSLVKLLTEFSKDTNEVFSINWLTNQIHIQINNILNQDLEIAPDPKVILFSYMY